MNLASNLNQIIDDMQGGIRNFSQHGVCSNCGSCCGNILPVSKSEIKKIRKYITRHNITAQVRTAPIAAQLYDMICPFRNEVEKKCMIYPVRPSICREFFCGGDPAHNAKIKAEHEAYPTVDMRSVFFGAEPVLGQIMRDMLLANGGFH
ncbi:MAG: YkgJ family cysteine cluster protein [Bacteroidaceae bacterium]|nr:YkgJ family cysteine cluster protein [Bacteroidaceae bacterium]